MIAAVVAFDVILVVFIVSRIVVVGSGAVVDGCAQVICIASGVRVVVALGVGATQSSDHIIGEVGARVAGAVDGVAPRTEVESGRVGDVLLLLLLLRQEP